MRPCWPRPPRRSCCAPAGSVSTPRRWRRMWPTRPTPACSLRRCAGSPRPASGSSRGRCDPHQGASLAMSPRRLGRCRARPDALRSRSCTPCRMPCWQENLPLNVPEPPRTLRRVARVGRLTPRVSVSFFTSRISQEMAQVPPLARALRKPYRQHQIPTRQPGEHHRQRADVIPPRTRPELDGGGQPNWLGQNRVSGSLGGRRGAGAHRGGQQWVPIGGQMSVQSADQTVGFPHRERALVWERARPGMRVKSHHDAIRGGPCRRPDASANR